LLTQNNPPTLYSSNCWTGNRRILFILICIFVFIQTISMSNKFVNKFKALPSRPESAL